MDLFEYALILVRENHRITTPDFVGHRLALTISGGIAGRLVPNKLIQARILPRRPEPRAATYAMH